MFYGWRIVGGAFIAQLFITGFMTYSFGLFVVPLQESYGATRAQVNLAMTATTLAGLVLSPLIGALADRVSSRLLMAAGAAIFALGLWGMSLSSGIWQFVAVFGVSISFASLTLGPLVCSTTIARWFSSRRGRALGIAAMGTSIGGLVLPVVLGHWIAAEDWRSALQYLAIAVAVGVLPLMLLLIRSHPQALGLHPDGEAPNPAAHAAPAGDIDFRGILRHPAFWSIGLSIGLLFSVYSALMANLVPYAQGTGIELEAAGILMTAIAGAGLVGKLLFGVAADRISLRLGLWLAIALVFTGMVILLQEPGYPVTLLACVIIGLAAGGMLPVWGALLAVIFGVTSYGRVMGLMNPLITLLVMPGFVITGYLYDRSGDYHSAFWLYLVLLAAAALILTRLRVPGTPAQAQAAASPG
ncbi:MFS transporter [Parahaliea mediterranea]|uniref:MFS transporter n=1 Tax=Parahaliea mediterranea TaxID=651086 RepID=A0A939DFU8_9GAMM|nr:MFS transporter [Parahaliea mediterranea]MBN7797483.1 MFS transporter [Parahaliea mediterranea]